MQTSPSNEFPSSDNTSTLENSPIPSYEPYQPIQVTLIDEYQLWSQFSKIGTEMVVNRKGRQMFPGVKLHFENLSPYKIYKVYMEFAPVDGVKYKFDRTSWTRRETIETSMTSSFVEHPQSPAEGFRWMNQSISFNIKLTNCLENNKDDTVYLRSMFKYMIIIHVEEGSDTTYRNLHLTRTFPLMNTTFIAVTTYQNHEVKDLKTATNIHAKGIRQKKLKQLEEMYNSVKENVGKRSQSETTADTSKRPRMESDLSSANIHMLFSKKDNSEIEKISPPSTILPNLNNLYPKPIEFMNRNDPFMTSVLPNYRRFEAPALSRRIPVTAPLSVQCPSPPLYSPFEHHPYYTPLLFPMHPQHFPVIPPYSSPSFYSSKWPVYQNAPMCQSSCISSTCGSASLNICPNCRDGFQNCVSCAAVSQNTQMFDHVAPSSTTDAEVSSSYENSVAFQPASINSDSTVSSVSGENLSDRSNVSDSTSTSVAEAFKHIYN